MCWRGLLRRAISLRVPIATQSTSQRLARSEFGSESSDPPCPPLPGGLEEKRQETCGSASFEPYRLLLD
jgi:hypothetical protein